MLHTAQYTFCTTNLLQHECFRTKVMIKHPRTVFEIENNFQAMKHVLATKIQSTWRGHVARKRYTWLRTSTIRCQRQFRQRLQHRQQLRLKEYEIVLRKVIFVQKNVRRMLAVRSYKKVLGAALTIRK